MWCLVDWGAGAGKGPHDDGWFDGIEIDLSLEVFRPIWVGAVMRVGVVALETTRINTIGCIELAADMH